MPSKLQLTTTPDVTESVEPPVAETPNPLTHTHTKSCNRRHKHSHEVTCNDPHTEPRPPRKLQSWEQPRDITPFALGVAPLLSGTGLTLMAVASEGIVAGEVCLAGAPLVAATGGAAAAAFGAGYLVGEGIKKALPALPAALENLADTLINGKPTFTSDAVIVASSSEAPKFAPKVTNSPENAPVVGVGESAPISLSLPQKASQHANTAATRDIE